MVTGIGEGFGDRVGEDIGEGRWLTYTELAEIRGIGRESAVKLAQRERWRKLSGNSPDRTARVFVPAEWLKPAKAGHIGEGFPEGFGELSRLLSGLEDTVTFVRERAEAAEARADAADADRRVAEARADAERTRADRADDDRRAAEARAEQAERGLSEERSRADTLRGDLDRARSEVQQAQEQAETLRMAMDEVKAGQGAHAAELAAAHNAARKAEEAAEELHQVEEARKARGRWARLRAAWRGE